MDGTVTEAALAWSTSGMVANGAVAWVVASVAGVVVEAVEAVEVVEVVEGTPEVVARRGLARLAVLACEYRDRLDPRTSSGIWRVLPSGPKANALRALPGLTSATEPETEEEGRSEVADWLRLEDRSGGEVGGNAALLPFILVLEASGPSSLIIWMSASSTSSHRRAGGAPLSGGAMSVFEEEGSWLTLAS